MSDLKLSKRHWILSDEMYQRLKREHKPIPSPVELSQTQKEFVEDRLQNKNQTEALIANVTDKIQPMLASKIAAHPNPTPAPPFSQRQYLDQRQQEARDQQQRFERAIEEEALGQEGSPARASSSRGSTVPAEASNLEAPASNITRLIYQNIKPQFQNKVNRIYSELLVLPGVSISPREIVVDGTNQGDTLSILDNLARKNKTLKFNIDPLLEKMSMVPYMASIIGNEAAVRKLGEMKDDSSMFESAILAKSRRTSTPNNRSVSLQSLMDNADNNDEDETLQQRGSGRSFLKPNVKIRWDTLF